MTQSELADVIGLARSTISNLEKGLFEEMRAQTYLLLLTYFGKEILDHVSIDSNVPILSGDSVPEEFYVGLMNTLLTKLSEIECGLHTRLDRIEQARTKERRSLFFRR